jgi:hypothetical protein
LVVPPEKQLRYPPQYRLVNVPPPVQEESGNKRKCFKLKKQVRSNVNVENQLNGRIRGGDAGTFVQKKFVQTQMRTLFKRAYSNI